MLQAAVDKMNEAIARENIKRAKKGDTPKSTRTLKGIIDSAIEKKSLKAYICTHEPKLSDPSSSRTGGIIANASPSNDGFIRSGNIKSPYDISCNAADFTIGELISVELKDGKTLAEHIVSNTDVARSVIGDARDKFIKTPVDAGSNVRQVFFPEEDDYCLLSILQPIGMMHEQKKRILQMNTSDETWAQRKLKNAGDPSDTGYCETINLVNVGYGGSKPRNISVLTNQMKGKALMFSCFPPEIHPREIEFPRLDFFKSINPWMFKDDFMELHRVLAVAKNNIHIRLKRDDIIRFITGRLCNMVWSIRAQEFGWTLGDYYEQLKPNHMVWLDDRWEADRNDANLEEFLSDMAEWFSHAYSVVLGDKALKIGDHIDHQYITAVMKEEEAIWQ